jgi:Tfp pilus assembly protein PilZ
LGLKICSSYITGIPTVKRFVLSFVILLASVAQSQEVIPGHIIVRLKAENQGGAGGVAAGIGSRSGGHTTRAASFHAKMSAHGKLQRSFGGLNMHHYRLNSDQDVDKTIEELKADPDVLYAEPDYVLHHQQLTPTARDTNQTFSLSDVQAMGGASAQGSYTQTYAPVKVNEAWSVMSPSTLLTPIVGVVDTGVDYTHHIFVDSGAIWTNTGETGLDGQGRNKATNGIDDDGNGYIDDVRGWNFYGANNNPMDDANHGTHVAGIILGVGQDIFATTMSAAKIRIMPLKFLGADGSGATSSAINAIYYAVNNGANVINNSWGGSGYSQALHDALSYAYTRKVLITAAAGNYTSDNDSTSMYPSNYPVPALISVAATNDYDNLGSFSNYGKNSVHVAAPGVGILSSIPGNRFAYMSGTSMAAPFVAGLGAMIYREAPNLTGYQIKNIIIATVNPVSGLSTKIFTSGRVNAYNAITESKNETSIQSIQPGYVAEAPAGVRLPAAEMKSGGCGTVSSIVYAQGAGGPGAMAGLAIALAFAMPMMLWTYLRARERKQGLGRRRHERFVMNSDISVKVGGRELVGHMQTISEGGLSFSAEDMLEKGGVVTMMITSPDGAQQIEVSGQVVWSEKNQAYGVQFSEAKEGVSSAIRNWSSNLVRAK